MAHPHPNPLRPKSNLFQLVWLGREIRNFAFRMIVIKFPSLSFPKAGDEAHWLYQRFPDAKLIWAGNDLMAFGAMTAWEKRGGKPGADAWFSGINTSIAAPLGSCASV